VIEYTRRFKLTYGMVFFGESYNIPKVDIIREFQYPQKKWFSEEFATVHGSIAEN
jgi:hypothetical protein